MKKISIVEDELIIAQDIKRVLVHYGFDVNGVYSTAESLLSNIDANLPDLIIMDIQLGEGMTGIEAAALIHQKYDIPIIFATAYADDKTVTKALGNKPFAYILKPFTDETLFTTVNVVFSRVEVEKQLKEAKERFKNLTDLLPLIVFEIDLDTKFTFINSYAKKYLSGVNKETVRLLDIIEEKQSLVNFLKKIASTSISEKIKLTINLNNKQNIPILLIADVIKKDDKLIGYRGVGIDFSDMEKIQKQLIELERLSAVSEIIARFKKELSRYLNESINIADEILQKSSKKDVDMEFIKNNMINALKITDNLELFRINTKLVFTKQNLNNLILDISRTLIYVLRERKIKFACNCDHSLPDIYFDAKIIKASILLLCHIPFDILKHNDTLLLETKYIKEKKTIIKIILISKYPKIRFIKDNTVFQMAKNLLQYHKAALETKSENEKIEMIISIPMQL